MGQTYLYGLGLRLTTTIVKFPQINLIFYCTNPAISLESSILILFKVVTHLRFFLKQK